MTKEIKRVREVSELKGRDYKYAHELLAARLEINTHEKEIAARKDECNKGLMELIDKYAIDSIVDPDVGTATATTRISKSLDTDLLVELLVDAGLKLRQVKGILEKATTEKVSKPFIQFKPIAKNGK